MSNLNDTPDAAGGEAATTPAAPVQHAVAKYTLYRLGLFFAALVLGYAAGLRTILLLIVALLVSGVASFFLLNRQRDLASTAVYPKVSKVKDKLEQRRAEEDAAAEAMRAEAERRRLDGTTSKDADPTS